MGHEQLERLHHVHAVHPDQQSLQLLSMIRSSTHKQRAQCCIHRRKRSAYCIACASLTAGNNFAGSCTQFSRATLVCETRTHSVHQSNVSRPARRIQTERPKFEDPLPHTNCHSSCIDYVQLKADTPPYMELWSLTCRMTYCILVKACTTYYTKCGMCPPGRPRLPQALSKHSHPQ